MAASPNTFWGGWRERIRALRNVPPLLLIVWRSGPTVVASGLGCRVLASLIPIAMLWVSKQILDAVQAHFSGKPLPEHFWWLVAAEFLLAATGAILGRPPDFSMPCLPTASPGMSAFEVIKHASRLDLASYEDPVFYDKLERARVQATDRIAMIHAIGALIQQFIVAVSLSAGIFWFSPWLLLLLIVAVVPAFPGRKPLRISRVFA